MLNYLEKIDILRSVGDAIIKEENPTATIVDNEIDILKQEIEGKRLVLQYMGEQMEAYEADVDAHSELNIVNYANIKEDIRALKEKSDILRTYLDVLSNPESEDFRITKLKREMDAYIKAFWAKLKPYNERSKAVSSKLHELRELRTKYLEARGRANSMI